MKRSRDVADADVDMNVDAASASASAPAPARASIPTPAPASASSSIPTTAAAPSTPASGADPSGATAATEDEVVDDDGDSAWTDEDDDDDEEDEEDEEEEEEDEWDGVVDVDGEFPDEDDEDDDEDDEDEWLAEVDVEIDVDDEDEDAEAENMAVQTAAVVRREFEAVRDFEVANSAASSEPPPAAILPVAAQARTSPEAWSAFVRPLLALLRKSWLGTAGADDENSPAWRSLTMLQRCLAAAKAFGPAVNLTTAVSQPWSATTTHNQCANAMAMASDVALYFLDRSSLRWCDEDLRSEHLAHARIQQPIGLAAAFGYVAMTYSRGSVRLVQSGSDLNVLRRISDEMANSAQIVRNDTNLILIVACNDSCVHICQVPSLAHVATIRGFPTAMNDAKLSPDRRWLACVGDTDHLYLLPVATNATTGALIFPEQWTGTHIPLGNVALERWRNSVTSQYVAWNKSSTLVACSGDGAISMAVVDVAQRSVFRTIATGAPTYAVQFSPTQENLLAIGWRSSMVLFVDVQTGLHQFINVATLARSSFIWSATPLITGICFASDGLVVYIGTTEGLVRLETLFVPTLQALCLRRLRSLRDSPLLPKDVVQESLPGDIVEHALPSVPVHGPAVTAAALPADAAAPAPEQPAAPADGTTAAAPAASGGVAAAEQGQPGGDAPAPPTFVPASRLAL